jgi:hypothetical protein
MVEAAEFPPIDPGIWPIIYGCATENSPILAWVNSGKPWNISKKPLSMARTTGDRWDEAIALNELGRT